MVKLTTKYLFRKISKKNQMQPRKKYEGNLDYLKRITHLYLQSQFIDKISSIPECQSVSVIYFQNNLLRTLEKMESFPNLTHLYLQHNFISKLENLDRLTSLKKLYLGNNEISVVEGLEKLVNLTELHLESQRLPQGETLYFDPLTLHQLGSSLKVLNVSNNNMTSIACLTDLVSLNKLIIDNNQIKDLDEVTETISQLPFLETLNSEGNPVASDRKFFDAVVFCSKSLKNLNGKQIDERTRVFITNLEYSKSCRRKLSGFSTQTVKSKATFPEVEKPPRSLNEIVARSSVICGSKLFPVLKAVTDSRHKTVHPSKLSTTLSSTLNKSLNVTNVSGSASYHL